MSAGRSEVIGGLPIVRSGGFALGTTPGGICELGPATQIPGYAAYDCRVPMAVTGDYTIAFVASASQAYTTLDTSVFEVAGGLSSNSYSLGSDNISVVMDGNPSSAVAGNYTKPTIFVARRIGNQCELFINGVLATTWITGTRTGTITGFTAGRNRAGNNNGNQTATLQALAVNRAWSNAEIVSYSRNPWQVFAPIITPQFFDAGGAATPAGTFASTLADVTLAADGKVADVGAFASTLAGVTLAASGIVGAAPTGTFASTLGGVALAAAGTITNVGSFATTLAGVTLAASGTVAPHVTGEFASTLDGVTLSASGFVGDAPVSSGFIQRRRMRSRIVVRGS
jgi:hypothetical protein